MDIVLQTIHFLEEQNKRFCILPGKPEKPDPETRALWQPENYLLWVREFI